MKINIGNLGGWTRTLRRDWLQPACSLLISNHGLKILRQDAPGCVRSARPWSWYGGQSPYARPLDFLPNDSTLSSLSLSAVFSSGAQ
jgi:hypothetical protein